MALIYRLLITSPKTKISAGKTYEFNNSTGEVSAIQVTQKAEGNFLSNLTARLLDPGFTLVNAFPDPSFNTLGLKLYLAQPGQIAATNLVFDGVVDKFSVGYPAPESLTIVAHDKSIAMRRQARHKTFKGKHAIGIVQAIAGTYGFTVDVDQTLLSLVTAQSTNTAVSTLTSDGQFFSDWDRCKSALASEGLYCFVYGDKLFIRDVPNNVYPQIFQYKQYPVISAEFNLAHVGAQKVSTYEFEGGSTAGGTKQYDQKSTNPPVSSPVRPVAGPQAGKSGTHTENPADKQQTNVVKLTRGRKDEATLVCDLLPDYSLWHVAKIAGWGPRFDSDGASADKDLRWRTIGVAHNLIMEAGRATTTITLKRGASKKAKKEAGVPASFEE